MNTILIISPSFAPCPYVGSARMTSLSAYLADKGFNVNVVCDDPQLWDDCKAKRPIPKGVNLLPVNIPSDGQIVENYKSVVEKELEKHLTILVICSVGPWIVYKFIIQLCQKYHVKYIIDRRDILFFDHRFIDYPILFIRKNLSYLIKYKRSESRVLRAAAAVVDVTPGLNIQAIKLTGDSRKCKYIPNGYEETETVNLSPIYGSYFVVAGKFFEYSPKLAKRVVRAIGFLNKKGIECKLVHIGAKEKALNEFCKIEGIDESLFLELGLLNYSETISLTKMSKGGVLVYDCVNGYGTKIYDYLNCNIPIICCLSSYSLAIVELLHNEKECYPCTNEQMLISAFSRALSIKKDELSRNTMQYSRKVSNEAYLNLITNVIGRPHI